MLKKRKLAAFALLELAIALAVLGIITSLSFPLLTSYCKQKSLQVTQKHQIQIAQALSAYVAANRRLPCPCDDPQSGIEKENCDVGLVPFKTIGLSEKIAKDGNHNWFTYLVHPGLTSNTLQGLSYSNTAIYPKSNHFCEVPQGSNFLKGSDGLNSPLVPNDNPTQAWHNFIAFALISHGVKGGGAISHLGKNRLAVNSCDVDKNINANDQLVFVDKPYSPNSFDDIVFWCSRNDLMFHYLGTPCQWE